MTPLLHILNWFRTKDREYKLDFASMAAHFHENADIELELDYDKKIQMFEDYLTDETLTKKEVMKRTILMKGLIDFILSGRDTEEGWEKSRKRNEAINKSFNEEHPDRPSDIYEKFMLTYEARKNEWISWAADWNKLKETSLSADDMFYWYM